MLGQANVFPEALGYSIALVFLYMLLWFFISLWKRNNGLVDIAWGLGFVLIAISTHRAFEKITSASQVVTILTTLWGLRLSYHLFRRNWGKKEDFRYAAWRKEWGKWIVPRSFFQIYMLQGVLMLIIALPIIVTNSTPQLFVVPVMSGVLVWLVGFFFEVVGDAQLRAFVSNPDNKGQLMTTGLWQYTRHPNYFGEAVMWWGIWIISLGTVYGIYTVISPLLLTFLLLKVSGVPMLEKKYEGRKDWDAYKQKTSMFIPRKSK